jgi:hypothetical protein
MPDTVAAARKRVIQRMRVPTVADYDRTKAAQVDLAAVDALIAAVQLAAGAAGAETWATMAREACPAGGLLWGNYDDEDASAVRRSWGRSRTGLAKVRTQTRTSRDEVG